VATALATPGHAVAAHVRCVGAPAPPGGDLVHVDQHRVSTHRLGRRGHRLWACCAAPLRGGVRPSSVAFGKVGDGYVAQVHRCATAGAPQSALLDGMS
jgi:hypothetical protein